MNSLEQINREVNRALRAVNRVAVGIASSGFQDRKAAIHEITQALAHIDTLQRMIVAQDPSLEYHLDPSRESTPAMRKIGELVENAEKLMVEKKPFEAEQVLRRALDLEPPPLVYEMIEKRLREL